LFKIILFLPMLALFFSGCIFFNERGISSTYYNDCTHYYDSMGIYHEKCDENIIDYKDLNPAQEKNGVYYIDF